MCEKVKVREWLCRRLEKRFGLMHSDHLKSKCIHRSREFMSAITFLLFDLLELPLSFMSITRRCLNGTMERRSKLVTKSAARQGDKANMDQ